MRRRVRLDLPCRGSEAARDCLAQAQAAVVDEQTRAALRALERLHALLVPSIDRFLSGLMPGEARSCGAGLLGVWRELCDLDIEREDVAELLVFFAAQEEMASEAPLEPVHSEADREAQWAWLAERLRTSPLPRSQWWRRLLRSADGGLGDRARIVVQRGAQIVLERLPTAEPQAGHRLCQTDLGVLEAGDRLTLQVQLPLPGRVALLHAAGDEASAELEVLLPAHEAEEAPRRALEVVEVSGEIGPAEGTEQSLVVLWAPELLPPSWYLHVVVRRRLPPEARLWRYCYRVSP
ncbi:MAG: hypothetical protein RMK29_06980 [Myxococcales bacterium]|nr:hypothetical protein [Myxococcota bacterium]MDW8281437.1 hypothetical protein [Myxococcales bacterium]